MVERGVNEELGFAVSSIKFSTDKDGDKTGRILLNNVRLTYPFLFTPRIQKNADGVENNRYEAGLLFDKRIPEKDLFEPLIEYAKYLYKDGGKNKTVLKFEKCFMIDGDDVNYNGYEGMWSIKTSNQEKPDIFDFMKEIVEKNDGNYYAGAYVDAIIQLWFQNNKFGKRINARLKAIRFRAHGEKLNSQTKVHMSMFDDLSELEEINPEDGIPF